MSKQNGKYWVRVCWWPLWVDSINDIPWFYATGPEWVTRGYKVKRGQQSHCVVQYWTGRGHCAKGLYSYDQVEAIGGSQAAQRRQTWWYRLANRGFVELRGKRYYEC